MVDTIKFSQMTDGGDIDNNKKTPGLKDGGNVLFNNPWTFLPPGTTAERPTPSSTVNFRLRFNTDEQLYEYYDAVLMVWTQLQESAFTQGPFIIYQADASIPDGQNLGALSNGILKQTITLGVATLDIALNGTDYYGPGFVIPPEDGGTGVNNGSNTLTLAGSLETVGAFSAIFNFTAPTNVTFPTSGTLATTAGSVGTLTGDSGVATASAGNINVIGTATGLTFTGATDTLTLGGTLNVASGGTGLNALTAHNLIIGNGTSAATLLAPSAVTNAPLLSQGSSADPAYGAFGLSLGGTLTTDAAHTLSGAFASTFNFTGITNVTFPTSGTLATTTGSVATLTGDSGTATASSGNINVIATGSGLSFTGSGSTLTLAGTLNVDHGGTGATTLTGLITGNGTSALVGTAITQYNVLTGGASNLPNSVAPSATTGVPLISQGAASQPVFGTAAIAGGGTGVTSVTTSPTASAWAGWDANRNMSADSFLSGYTTTATAAGTTTLTVNDTYWQYFTGSTTQTVVLPVTSTLVLGQSFYLVNNSSGSVTVQSSGANTVLTLAANTSAIFTCILTSGTTAASWNYIYDFNAGGSGTVSAGTANQLAYYASTGTTVVGLTSANNGVLRTDGSGVPSISSTLPSGLTIPGYVPTTTTISAGGIATGGGDLSANRTITVTGATQSDQETGTSTSVAVTPGVQKYHPAHPKAWVYYTSVTTTTINASFGVTSLTDGGTGITTVNYTTTFSSTNNNVNYWANDGTNRTFGIMQTNGNTTVALRSTDFNGTLTDMAYNMVSVWGDI